MSLQQLDPIIKDIRACFGGWTEATPLAQMREDWDALSSSVPSKVGAKVTPVDAGGVRAFWVDAPGAAKDRVVVYFHGGGYAFGSLRSHQTLVEQLSLSAKARVLFVDYRLAPEHPFPAAVDDATAAYRWALDQGYKPERMAIGGDSAGGGLTVATLVALKRGGTKLPACAVLLSPWVDLECSGETMTTKAAEDPMVGKALTLKISDIYMPNGGLREPLASPLYADLSGLPPLSIQVGSRECLLDDSRRIAERAKSAGVKVKLEECEGLIHVFQVFCTRLEEGVAAIDRLGAFIARHMTT